MDEQPVTEGAAPAGHHQAVGHLPGRARWLQVGLFGHHSVTSLLPSYYGSSTWQSQVALSMDLALIKLTLIFFLNIKDYEHWSYHNSLIILLLKDSQIQLGK